MEYESAEALNQFRVRHLDGDDVAFAPQQRNFALLVSADGHRFPPVAADVCQHGDLEADVRPERTVPGRRPPALTAAVLRSRAVGGGGGVRREFDETEQGDVDALARLSLDRPQTQRTARTVLLGQRAREVARHRSRFYRALTVAHRSFALLHCITQLLHQSRRRLSETNHRADY